MKTKVISGVLGLIVVLLVAVMVAPSFIDWSKYKDTIKSEIQAKSGYTVNIDGDLSLAVLPFPHLSAEKVTILNDQAQLASVEEAEISVELLPLLSKNVSIRSVNLVKPVITLATNAEGQGSWVVQRDEKQEGEVKKDIVEDQQQAKGEEPKTSEFKISSLEVSDGKLVYKDGVKGTTTTLDKVNMEGELHSLQGPYEVEGSAVYNGRPVTIDMEAGRSDNGNMPLDLAFTADDKAVEGKFEGTINQQTKAIKGEFDIEGNDFAKYAGKMASGPFSASGEMAFGGDTLVLDDLEAELAGLKFAGDIKALNENKRFQFNLKETTGNKGKGTLGQALAGANVKADLTLEENAVQISSYTAKLNNSILTGQGAYNFGGNGNPAALTLSMNADRLNVDQWLGLSKSIKEEGGSSAAKSEKKSGSKSASVKGFSIPMNMDVDAAIDSLVYQGKSYRNVKADIVAKGNNLRIANASAQTAFDTTASATGTIGNTQNLSGLDLNLDLKTADVEKLAQAYSVNVPQSNITVGALEADATLKGSLDALQFNAKGKGKGLVLTASGTAQNPTGNMKIDNLALRVQHPNMVQAIQIVNPGFSMGRYWQKPLDIKTSLSLAEKVITLASLGGKAGPVDINSANLTINTGGSVPAVKGNLALGALVLPGTSANTANQASATSGGKATSSSSDGGRWSSQPIDSKWMSSVKLDLDVKAESIAQNRWLLNSPSMNFSLSDGVLNVSSLKAGLFDGSVNMDGQVKAGSNGQGFSSVSWNSQASSINGALLYSAIVNKSSDLISGRITSASEQLTTSGSSMSALISNLNGNAKVNGENIVIKGVDIAGLAGSLSEDIKPGDTVKGLLASSIYKGNTSFDTLSGNFDIAKGIVNLNPLYLDGSRARFDMTGRVNLPDWTLNVVNKVTVKNSDVPPFEMSFSGSLSNPKRLGGDILEDYLQRKIERKVGKILEDQGIAEKINDKLGIPLLGGKKTTETETEPASGDNAAATEEPETIPAQRKDPTPEDLLKGAIGEFLR